MFPEESLAFREQEYVHSAQYCGTEPFGFNVTPHRMEQPNAAADDPKHCNLANEIRIDEQIRSAISANQCRRTRLWRAIGQQQAFPGGRSQRDEPLNGSRSKWVEMERFEKIVCGLTILLNAFESKCPNS
jgi:hypothetical protein